MKILIVDENRLSADVLSGLLESRSYEVITAANGREALEVLRQTPIYFVISEWTMTTMSGPELCQRVRRRPSHLNYYVYFLLLTDSSNRHAARICAEVEADDFLLKPVDIDLLMVRLRTVERLTHMEMLRTVERLTHLEIELENRNRKLEEAYKSLHSGLLMAAALQKNLLPHPTNMRNIALNWIFLPSDYVAGDMFGYFSIDEKHMGFFMLDVAGHGVSSALVSFTLTNLLSQIRQFSLVKETIAEPPYYRIRKPSEVVSALNQHLCAHQEEGFQYFSSLIYGFIEYATGNGNICCAGHPPPLWWKKQAGILQKLDIGNILIGIQSDAIYTQESFQLQVGDRLLLYSDGIIECPNPHGEFFGEKRLSEIVVATAPLPLSVVIPKLKADLSAWCQNSNFPDDVSLLVMEWQAPF